MQFEKINEDKIRIIFNLNDLKEKNVDYHDFMANSIATQKVFLDMLNQAEKEIGFITTNYQLIIEALASSDGSFILTVTRSKEEKEKVIKNIKKLKAKPKLLPLNEPLPTLIYKFNTFDDFYDLCYLIKDEHLNKLSKTFNKAILYSYNNDVYLLLKTSPKADIKEVKYIISLVNESMADLMHASELFQYKLYEFGKVFVKNNCFLKVRNK